MPFVPLLLLASLVTAIVVSARSAQAEEVPKPKRLVPRATHVLGQEAVALAESRRYTPEEERFLSLLVLFARDKRYPAGQKRYLTTELAIEALRLANQFELPKTMLAIRKDDALPDDEYLRGRSRSIRQLALSYGTGGRL
jgi:hypothetical protein